MSRSVTLTARLTETDETLRGTRAWVAKQIEESEVRVSHTTGGSPAVFLKHPTGGFMVLAEFGDQLGSGEAVFDHWPYYRWVERKLFGVHLTAAGTDLLTKFSKKCLTLLKYRMRKQNRAVGNFKVKLVEQEG